MKTIKITDQIDIDQESIDLSFSLIHRFTKTKAFAWSGGVAVLSSQAVPMHEGALIHYSVRSEPQKLLSTIYVELRAVRSPLLDDKLLDNEWFPLLAVTLAHCGVGFACIDEQVVESLGTKCNMDRVRALIYAGYFGANYDGIATPESAQRLAQLEVEDILQFGGYGPAVKVVGLLAASIAVLKHCGHPISWITEP